MLTESQQTSLAGRIVQLIRWIAVRGLAAALTGILVFGIGGRLVMLASRLIHPEAVGRITENGNRIGEFTVEGTIGLIIFGGLLSGVVAGIVWVMVKQWIPDNAALVGLGAVAIGGLNLIQADNRDFAILGDSRIDIVLLLGLLFVFGVALLPVDKLLDRRLPGANGVAAIVTYSLLVSFGAALAMPVVASFFSKEFCFCTNPPVWIGVFFLITALATGLWWVFQLRGSKEPPRWLIFLGSGGLAMTSLVGAVYLAREILAIV